MRSRDTSGSPCPPASAVFERSIATVTARARRAARSGRLGTRVTACRSCSSNTATPVSARAMPTRRPARTPRRARAHVVRVRAAVAPAMAERRSGARCRTYPFGGRREDAGGPPSRRRAAPRDPAPHAPHRVVEVVHHALLQRDDGVVRDVDRLGADLGAALGDVAVADAGLLLQVAAARGGVERVHLEARDAYQEARAGEGVRALVIAQHVAHVLAEEALDALAELLHPVDVLLLRHRVVLEAARLAVAPEDAEHGVHQASPSTTRRSSSGRRGIGSCATVIRSPWRRTITLTVPKCLSESGYSTRVWAPRLSRRSSAARVTASLTVRRFFKSMAVFQPGLYWRLPSTATRAARARSFSSSASAVRRSSSLRAMPT